MTVLTPEISSWRVLVVDDKPSNLKLLDVVLRTAGADVITVDDSEAVIETVSKVEPNLILLDLAMPMISGWELQQQLRTRPEWDGIPIIAVSALAMESDIKQAEAAGFNGYITKPYRIESLRTQLMEFVDAFLKHVADTRFAPQKAATV